MPVDRVAFTAGDSGTAYTAKDVCGGLLHFKGIPANTELLLTSTVFENYVAAVPASMTSFTLHLYNERPTAIADNAAFDVAVAADRSKRVASIPLGSPADKGSYLSVETDQNLKHIKSGSQGLWGHIETAGGYTPAGSAESYAITLAAMYAIEQR